MASQEYLDFKTARRHGSHRLVFYASVKLYRSVARDWFLDSSRCYTV